MTNRIAKTKLMFMVGLAGGLLGTSALAAGPAPARVECQIDSTVMNSQNEPSAPKAEPVLVSGNFIRTEAGGKDLKAYIDYTAVIAGRSIHVFVDAQDIEDAGEVSAHVRMWDQAAPFLKSKSYGEVRWPSDTAAFGATNSFALSSGRIEMMLRCEVK
jgi:hypothetical protein